MFLRILGKPKNDSEEDSDLEELLLEYRRF